jgi:hypothetical protein
MTNGIIFSALDVQVKFLNELFESVLCTSPKRGLAWTAAAIRAAKKVNFISFSF